VAPEEICGASKMSYRPGGNPDETIEIPMLQVTDLYQKRQTRDKARLKAYNQMLEVIYHRVRVTSQLPTGQTYLLYNIPTFILGLPRIDLEDCVVYLVYQLRSSGFEIRYTYPNLLYISWKHHEKDYLVNNSPILQAMLATKSAAEERVAAEAKRGGQKSAMKKSVRFDGEPTAGAASGRAQPMHGLPPGRPKKSVDDYTLPNSFYNTVERPTSQASGAISALWGGGGNQSQSQPPSSAQNDFYRLNGGGGGSIPAPSTRPQQGGYY
jgi:hypothetical protein